MDHVVFSFNGASAVDRPGEICVEAVPGERLKPLITLGSASRPFGGLMSVVARTRGACPFLAAAARRLRAFDPPVQLRETHD